MSSYCTALTMDKPNDKRRYIGKVSVIITISTIILVVINPINLSTEIIGMSIKDNYEATELHGIEGGDPIVGYMIKVHEDKPQINCLIIEPITKPDDPTLLFNVTAYDENCTIILEINFKINNTEFYNSIDGIRSSDDTQNESNDELLDSANQYTRMFEDVYFSGSYTTRTISATYIGDYFNDEISSIRTWSDYWTSYYWRYYEHSNYGGKSVVLIDGDDVQSLVPIYFNDVISSFAFVGIS